MKNLGIPKLTDYEFCLLESAVDIIAQHIEQGEDFVREKEPPPCDPCDKDPKAPICPEDWCEKLAAQKREKEKRKAECK